MRRKEKKTETINSATLKSQCRFVHTRSIQTDIDKDKFKERNLLKICEEICFEK